MNNPSDWKTYQENRLLHAESYLNQSIDALDSLRQTLSVGDFHDIRAFQLLLQYRLDMQDTLLQLLQLEHSSLQILGISTLNSGAVNMERIRYALGGGELRDLLAVLNRLISELLNTIHREQRHRKQRTLKTVKTTPSVRKEKKLAMHKLEQAIALENSFHFILKQVTESVDFVGGEPQPGPVLDFIEALSGPISRFYQAICHGLTMAMDLYEQFKPHLNTMVLHLIEQPAPPMAALQPSTPSLFTTARSVSALSQLEERATARRTLNLFGH